jgi:chloramphenicol 3-O-phosphotransferase
MLAASNIGEAWFHTGDNHLVTGIPRQLMAPRTPAENPHEGWDIVVEDRTLLDCPHAGPTGLRLLDGMYRAAASMAGAGVHVILDDVVWELAVADLAMSAFRDVSRLTVEVRCEVDVALAREAARVDRYVGGVAAYASRPPLVSPDVTIDTTKRSPKDCANELVALVRSIDEAS